MKGKQIAGVLAFFIAFMAAPAMIAHATAAASAQSASSFSPQPASLSLQVSDETGAVIPGAKVTISQEHRQVAALQTDQSGSVSFSAAPGRYEVQVQHEGFKTSHQKNVFWENDQALTITLQISDLAIGPVAGPAPDLPLTQVYSESQVTPNPVKEAAKGTNWNFGALIQSGFGVTEDRGSFKFLLVGAHAGRILTPQLGNGFLRGNFEYGVELFPLWQSYTPKFQRISCNGPVCSAPYTVGGTFTGVSITPIILRWNLTRGERWMPWVQGAGGLIWTNHKYPAFGNTDALNPGETGPSANTSVWNFTPQFGVGTHYFVRSRQSIDVGANAVHISSASLGDKNPGVNASVQFSLGYSWWK